MSSKLACLRPLLFFVFVLAPVLCAWLLVPSAFFFPAALGAFALVASLLLPDATPELLLAALLLSAHHGSPLLFSLDACGPTLGVAACILRAGAVAPGRLTPGRLMLLLAASSALKSTHSETGLVLLLAAACVGETSR